MPWTGRYRGKLEERQVEWRILDVAGELHWLEGEKSKVTERNLLTHLHGGLVPEDSTEKFRFNLTEGGGILFQMWGKEGGRKMGEAILERVQE